METTTRTNELTDFDRDRLTTASAGVDAGFSDTSPGVQRYEFYRRHGYSKSKSLAFALAWSKNAVEQYERRLSHETGAEGWRAVN